MKTTGKIKMKIIEWLATPEIVEKMYKKQAKNNLAIDTKIVNVKKGKIRYRLLIAKDKNLKTVFNLGRHNDASIYERF